MTSTATEMNSDSPVRHLRYIQYTEGVLKLAPEMKRRGETSEGLRDILFDIEFLLDSVLHSYAGQYPATGPCFLWDTAIDLPWAGEYWIPAGHGEAKIFIDKAEIEQVVNELFGDDDDDHIPEELHVYAIPDPLPPQQKERVQYYSIHIVHCLDICLKCFANTKVLAATLWLTMAYKNLVELNDYVVRRFPEARQARDECLGEG